MITRILLSLGLLPISLLLSPAASHPPMTGKAFVAGSHRPADQGFALVELFTSEGCSSCPPAEELAATLPQSYPSGVFLLSFHVDYWDRLGWKDPFSKADYTDRQTRYAETLKLLRGIYTPQAIVNGKIQLVGSDEPKLRKAIDGELAHTINPPIDDNAHTTDDKTIAVDFTLENKSLGALQAALVQV